MGTLSRDARGFIEGVTRYIRSDSRAKGVLPKVRSLLTRVTSQAKKEQVAHVTSAVALGAPEKKRTESALSGLLGHPVQCVYRIDASLLGGMKIQVADWIVDTSLLTQLGNIARSIVSV